MNTDKKHLLLISNSESTIFEIREGMSLHFNINVENSMHTGYRTAINFLPDIILIDKTSLTDNNLKNLSNFKSTHFLNKCWLILYAPEDEKGTIDAQQKGIVDDVIYNSISIGGLCGKLINRIYANSSLSNYWKDSFLGLFNLLSMPVLLLQQDNIVSMNDAFKQIFKINETEGLKLTDFVNCENKMKVKASLRHFSRGKHMKAITKTALQLRNNKVRNAKISFSKLDKMIDGQFIMMINFYDNQPLLERVTGSNLENFQDSFEENSSLTDYSFTKREKEIIQLLCKGYKTKEIAETLFISPKTIEKHRANIVKRTNSDTILESIIYAINHNLIDVKHA